MASSEDSGGSSFEFENVEALQKAKGDLYSYLLRHGIPKNGIDVPINTFKLRLRKQSPLRVALESLTTSATTLTQFGDLLVELRGTIYRSELKFGVADHFDAQLAHLSSPDTGDLGRLVAEPRKEVPDRKRRTLFGRLVTALTAAVALWVVATAYFAVQERSRAADVITSTAQTLRSTAAALAFSLPAFYAKCLARTDNADCAPELGVDDPIHGSVANDLGSAYRDLGALIGALGRIGPQEHSSNGRLLIAWTPEGCSSHQRGAKNIAATLRDLCLARVRLMDHMLCVMRPAVVARIDCRETAQLGVAESRFESGEERARRRPVNVFAQTIEFRREVQNLAVLANTAEFEIARVWLFSSVINKIIRDLSSVSREFGAFRERILKRYSYYTSQSENSPKVAAFGNCVYSASSDLFAGSVHLHEWQGERHEKLLA